MQSVAAPAGNLSTPVAFGARLVGPGHPCLVVAEIGINHNGDLAHALRLIDAAKAAGADAVKFQAGDPERYVNRGAWDTTRETPWGVLRYIDYRQRMELSDDDFASISAYCAYDQSIPWFVSPLDAHAVQRFERFNLPAYKVASPKLTDTMLLERIAATGRTVIASTGMSSMEEIDAATELLPFGRTVLLHAVSAYPCDDLDVNLAAFIAMQHRYMAAPVGYSGHERGIWPTLAAVALGAYVVERHFTLDRSAWGSDQAASLEPSGFSMLVRGIRSIEQAMSGVGTKQRLAIEEPNYKKFRSTA